MTQAPEKSGDVAGRFSSDQRALAIRALEDAEERTLDYYCIPPHRGMQLQYDLVTRQDREWEPLPEAALAKVLPLRQSGIGSRSARDFYRILLNDPGILTVLHREKLEANLYPFLVYILTHEMIHIVRLSTILTDGHEAHLTPEIEERRVHSVAYRILSNADDLKLGTILSRFHDTAGELNPFLQS